jgi:hypothetical protein
MTFLKRSRWTKRRQQAAIDEINNTMAVPITVRQIKYLNNIVELDHRAIKHITRPMLGFKSFRGASNVLAGIELMHMIRKGQFNIGTDPSMSFADQLYALAGQIRPAQAEVTLCSRRLVACSTMRQSPSTPPDPLHSLQFGS